MPDLTLVIPLLIVVIYLLSSIKILAEYERGVIFRLGRVLPQPKGPGVILVFAPIDRIVRISLRIEAMEVPPQDVITRDNVTVKVNAVVYFRVLDPTKAVLEVSNFLYATSQVAQTTLRSALGEVELDELLSQREKLNLRLQSVLDAHTGPWGVKVTVVEVKQVDLAGANDPRHRPAGRSRARAARQDHPRRGRVHGGRETRHGGRGDSAPARRSSAPLPSDAGGDRRRKEHHGCFPDADRYTLIFRNSAEQLAGKARGRNRKAKSSCRRTTKASLS